MASFPIIVSLAIENPSGHLLLIKPKGRGEKFCYPSTFVEYGERLTGAAIRAAREEVGLEIHPATSLGHYLMNNLVTTSMHVVMGTKISDDAPVLRLRSDHRAKWFSKDGLEDDRTVDTKIREQFADVPWNEVWFPPAPEN